MERYLLFICTQGGALYSLTHLRDPRTKELVGFELRIHLRLILHRALQIYQRLEIRFQVCFVDHQKSSDHHALAKNRARGEGEEGYHTREDILAQLFHVLILHDVHR